MGEESKYVNLLNQLEHILESDPLMEEVGFIHPSQFANLNKEANSPLLSSTGTFLQPQDENGKRKMLEANYSGVVFWSSDHKLGISTEVLLPLYKEAKHAFMDALKKFKKMTDVAVMVDENMSVCFSSSLSPLESEVMKHSRALLLLSCDFGTAWNSRKLILSNKQHLRMFMDELLLSELILSYAPKSERAWSHRRWVIQVIAGKGSNLEEIVEKESELIRKIAEKSKMNYRAWNHRCWLVSYMSREQVVIELDRSRGWAGLHVADNSCFHYRTRLMLTILEVESQQRQDSSPPFCFSAELRQLWKEELNWDEMLINRYIGREALWLHRRFLAFCWIKYFATGISDFPCQSDHRSTITPDIDILLNNESQLFLSCKTFPDYDFEDFQAQAIFSATYILWLTMQISKSLQVEVQEKLPAREAKALLNEVCPGKSFLWNSLGDLCHIA